MSGEPIAVVGMACRLPGAPSLEAYAELLAEARDATREVPADRWPASLHHPEPATPGRLATRRGGFLDDVARFEPELFGISPREALAIDPQQRLLLEVAWHALEDAGIAPDSLRGAACGCYVGIGQNDYARRRLSAGALEAIEPHDGTGNGLAFAAGRLSYVFGLEGPNLAVDTACSASLVALHLACQALRAGECELALVGGVQLMLSPEVGVFLSQARALAPDGRSKAFSADADGFGRGEGCGVLVLQRAGDADRQGRRVRARVLGSALNHGGASAGLTVPRAAAQQAALRGALEAAAIGAETVDYVEAHGTGTALGDPIELRALGAVYGAARPAGGAPLRVGSVKASIGHLEAAAGVAGVIKVALALEAGRLWPQPAFSGPTRRVDWSALRLALPDPLAPVAWVASAPRRAGVSAFGMAGTNAHAILEQGPAPAPASPPREPLVLPLAARSAEGLRALAGELAGRLGGGEAAALPGMARALQRGRARLPHRLALVGSQPEALLAQLAQGGWQGQREGDEPPAVAFVCCGQGGLIASVEAGEQAAWIDAEPALLEALERAAAVLDPRLPAPLLATLRGERPGALRDAAVAQPALVALQLAQAALWRARGLAPEAVVGHSLGELSAAALAGALDEADALRLAAARGRAMAACPPGAMLIAACDEAAARAVLTLVGGETLALASVDGPRRVGLSGVAPELERLEAALAARGIGSRRLATDRAFHGPLIEPALPAIAAAAAALPARPAAISWISTRDGALQARPTSQHWSRQAVEPVRFDRALQALAGLRPEVVIELGARPLLGAALRRGLAAAGRPLVLSSAGEPSRARAEALAALFAAGVAVRWPDDPAAPLGDAPRTVFGGRRYLLEAPATTSPQAPGRLAHPLLGERLPELAGRPEEATWSRPLACGDLPGLEDHCLDGVPFVPGVTYSELADAAVRELFGEVPYELRDLSYRQLFFLPPGRPVTLQVSVRRRPPDEASLEVHSRQGSDGPWTHHASGEIALLAPALTGGSA